MLSSFVSVIRILDYDFSCTTIVLLLDATSRKFLCVKVWFDHMVPPGGLVRRRRTDVREAASRDPIGRARARQPGDERLVASPGRSLPLIWAEPLRGWHQLSCGVGLRWHQRLPYIMQLRPGRPTTSAVFTSYCKNVRPGNLTFEKLSTPSPESKLCTASTCSS